MTRIPLSTPLYGIRGVGPGFLKRLERLGIKTVRDLLWHFPSRYEDFSKIYKIADLEPGQHATVQGVVEDVALKRSWRRGIAVVEATIRDESGSIGAIWFNQPYVASSLKPGRLANFAGKVSLSDEGELRLNHPAYEFITRTNTETSPHKSVSESVYVRETRHTARLVPIYPETKGLTSKGLRYLVQPILKNIESIPEWIPKEILTKYDLPEINLALKKIHFPDALEEAALAKKRFEFEDLFLLQLYNFEQKLKLAEEKAPSIKTDIEWLKQMIAGLPYELTLSQKKSLWEIIKDLEGQRPMNRLLQGDVGSGKTVVAALAALTTAKNGFQTAFMAPTEVLARQHFQTLKNLFFSVKSDVQPILALITSSEARVVHETDFEASIPKSELLEKIKNGETKIIIGTHSLIQEGVRFANLGFVVVDEQHRFGVRQRQALAARTNTDTTRTITDKTQTNTDEKANGRLLYENLTYKIRGAALNVKKELGTGQKESVYQKALDKEFQKLGFDYKKELTINVKYDGEKVGVYRPDFVVEDKVIVEIKALPAIGRFEKQQVWHHLKSTDYRLAILINFGKKGVQFERIIYGYTDDASKKANGPSKSVSSPYQSVLVPHFLSMSATPIPRTLMMTVFGDLDISTITELPAGRKNIITKIVPPKERKQAYDFIRAQVKEGRQVFVICPRIEPRTNTDNTRTSTENSHHKSVSSPYRSVLWDVKSVKEEYEKLSKKVFPDLRVAMLHGKMKPREKEKIMTDFRSGKTDILVSTSVIEVGVDIPNATIMMIEGADRFGLAQIYQFRGRVGRGEHQSYCFLFTDSDAQSTKERLKAVIEAKNGFELAERDLKLRGPGELLGEEQAGMPDLAMRALEDIELVKMSREAAAGILQKDQKLKTYPLLKRKLIEFKQKAHFE